MKRTQVAKIEFAKPVKILEVGKDGIIFSNGSVLIDLHYQDCCEVVYADWNIYKDEPRKDLEEITYIEVFSLKNSGIVLEFHTEQTQYIVAQRWFIPCYDIQNGYYSDELLLTFGTVDFYSVYDISNSVFHDYTA